MRRLNLNEIPKTRVEFIKEWNTNCKFRAMAEYTGFAVIQSNVVMPNGMVAGTNVK